MALAHFRDLSIRTKLLTGFMLTSLVALLLTVAALATYDTVTFRNEMVRDVDTLAGIIGENASSSVAFNDRQSAQATLASLRSQPQIVAAAIYDNDRQLFAARGNVPKIAPVGASTMTASHVEVSRRVLFNGARVGTVWLRSDLSEMRVRRARFLELAAAVGGDFYEFRRTNGGAWLGIGDVTGHGVTSGLIMMMAQSMFTLLCEQKDGHVTPSQFVALLNRAMFYNLRSRLDQDKFMTM